MKKITVLLLALLFTGCSTKSPEMTNLNLTISGQETGIYSADISAAIQGKDARKSEEVIVYHIKSKPQTRLVNQRAPHILLTNQLANALRDQGLQFQSDSNVRIDLIIEELLVTVTQPNILYTADARCRILLNVKNRGTTLSRAYDREATQDSVGRPDVAELEEMLNKQLSDILNQILGDEKILATIIGQ